MKKIGSITRFSVIVKIGLWAVFLLSFAIPHTYAQDGVHAQQKTSGHLSFRREVIQIDSNLEKKWVADYFEIDEFWPIDNEINFFDFLKSSGVHPNLIGKLKLRHKSDIPLEQLAKALAGLKQNRYQPQSFIFIPAELKVQIPQQMQRLAYQYLIRSKQHFLSVLFPDLDTAQSYFSNFFHSKNEIEKLLSSTYEIDGFFYFFFNRNTWSLLNDAFKVSFIKEQTRNTEGLKVFLSFSEKDDLKELAQRFAGERDSEEIENELKRQLKESPKKKVTIPLQQILHPFIKDRVNTYSPCIGPNCYHSAISVNEGFQYNPDLRIFNPTELMDIVLKRYRFVKPDDNLRMGDLLIYLSSNGEVEHTSTYISENLVYTKNGFHKNKPYIFQKKSENESSYFPGGQFRMMAMRIPKKEEFVASPGGVKEFHDPIPYYTDKTLDLSNSCFEKFQ